MPLYDSKSVLAKSLMGIHLYHFSFSNCSQRVRLALEEKGLPWISHHLDLSRNEHINTEYQAINPKGVVPTLVHNGQVVIESNDILFYLEEKFPAQSLIPRSKNFLIDMDARIDIASKTQIAVKVLTFDTLFRAFLDIDTEELQYLQANRHNQEVLEFMEDFHDDNEAWALRVKDAHKVLVGALTQLECSLNHTPWLSGNTYGLADISWVVNAHRLFQVKYSLEAYPKFCDWYRRVSSRPAFERAITHYQPTLETA